MVQIDKIMKVCESFGNTPTDLQPLMIGMRQCLLVSINLTIKKDP